MKKSTVYLDPAIEAEHNAKALLFEIAQLGPLSMVTLLFLGMSQ